MVWFGLLKNANFMIFISLQRYVPQAGGPLCRELYRLDVINILETCRLSSRNSSASIQDVTDIVEYGQLFKIREILMK